MNDTTKPLVLFVDDEPDIRELIEIGMRRFNPPFDAAFASDRESALRVVRDRHPAAVVLDVNLSGETGMAIAEDLRDHYPQVAKAVLTAYDMSVVRANAEALGMEVWAKPITDMDDLIGKVMGLLASRPPAQTGVIGANVVRALAAAAALLWGAHVHKV